MLANPSLKQLTVNKCERKAYSVSGAPVVTLGSVDLEFKVNGSSYTHKLIILRGLIHPMLLGIDFLLKYQANIKLSFPPSVTLYHPVNKIVKVEFIKPTTKAKPETRVSLLSDVEIPPLSICYVDAYISNVEKLCDPAEANPNRAFGITAIQKEDATFDPGFIMRDGIIDANAAKFKVDDEPV